MKFGYILNTLILTLFTSTLFAQGTCPGPAPNQLSVVSIAHTEIELDWDDVPGAATYKFRTIDAITGTLINEIIVNAAGYTQGGLTPGQEYIFQVSSSYCSNGPFGPYTTIELGTNIVVNDIILQLDCVETGTSSRNEDVGPSSQSIVALDGDPNGCHVFAFTNPQTPTETLYVLIGNTIDNQLEVKNLESDTGDFALEGNGPLYGNLTGTGTDLFDLEMITDASGDNSVEVNWSVNTDVIIYYCEDCDESNTMKELAANPTETSLSVVPRVYPNPASGPFNVEITDEDSTVEIFDLSGQRWYTNSAINGTKQLKIATANWPNGTYIIRWIRAGEEPLIQHFLKQD